MRIRRGSEAGRGGARAPVIKPTGEHVSWAWVVAGLLLAGAWFGLPRYLDTFDRTIVFADPDCMQVTVDRVAREGLTLAERVDSTEVWTMTCLDDRQNRALRRANLIGWVSNTLIALAGLVAALSTAAWIRGMRGSSQDRSDSSDRP